MENKQIVIRVKNLSVKFGEVDILKNVSFELNRGEFAGIIGPNGAGKSTLVKAILGFIPFDGEVVVNGKVGYVPQLSQFNRELPMSVYDFVRIAIRRDKKCEGKVEEVLKRVGLEGYSKKLVGKLSGGEYKRAMLARALLSEPDILILDEPESGVDELGKARFYELLNELREEKGITILMVSHDIGMVFEKCSTVMCLNKTLHCHGPTNNISPEDVKKMFGEFDIWLRADKHYEVEHIHHVGEDESSSKGKGQ